MFSTACGSCQLFSPDDSACRANQYCVVGRGGQVEAPGFCRLYAKPPGDPLKTVDVLVEEARAKAALRFDLIALFDERRHTSDELSRTVQYTSPFMKKLIVIDMTGSALRQMVAKDVMAEEGVFQPYSLDCLVSPEESHQVATDWALRLVNAPYFVVLEAGRVLRNVEALAEHIQNVHSRAIHWYFPIKRGNTPVISRTGTHGAWITGAYRQLGGNMTKPIFEKLDTHEKLSGMTLSYLLDEAEIE